MGSAIFRHGIGQSEPDGHAPHAEAGGAPGLDPWADQGLSGHHAGGAAGLAWRARRRGEPCLDLALPESLRPHPQEADAGGGRAQPARRDTPSRAVETLSGPGGPAQAGLHRRDLHEDQHVAQARLGSQGTKGLRLGPLRPLGTFCISTVLFCSRRRPSRGPATGR